MPLFERKYDRVFVLFDFFVKRGVDAAGVRGGAQQDWQTEVSGRLQSGGREGITGE